MPTLNWIGKEAVVNHHLQVPFHLLKDVPELSVGDPGSGNLIVQGDNLVALKALLPYYAGQVKCIYIDPPYNTGNEGWIYNDNVNSPLIREWLGKAVGRETEDLSRHDKWLMVSRQNWQSFGNFAPTIATTRNVISKMGKCHQQRSRRRISSPLPSFEIGWNQFAQLSLCVGGTGKDSRLSRTVRARSIRTQQPSVGAIVFQEGARCPAAFGGLRK
jgi:hypothetical protein